MENFLLQGLFSAQRVQEFEAYVKALPDDSVAPKNDLLEVLANIKEQQAKIAQINAEAQLMQQRAQQFLMGDPDEQATMMADASMAGNEAEVMQQEAQLDEQAL
jgi:hypothetical protein